MKAAHSQSMQTHCVRYMPIARAAPRDRSSVTPRVNGPRSLITTVTEFSCGWMFATQRRLWRSIMKFPRRTFSHLAVGAAALPAVPRIARAEAHPSRLVRIIVGFPAGGATDIQARLLGQWLSGRLGQPFIIEHRPRRIR